MGSGLGERHQLAASQSELRARLERIVSSNPDNAFGVPGAVFAIQATDGTLVSVALGVDACGEAVTTESFTHLASASKLATGLLILRLCEEGVLDLDAEIGTYLPEAAAARAPGVTLKRMLSHTSGLPLEVGHELSDPPGPLELREGMEWPGEFAEACLVTAPIHEPGTRVQYSNVAFGLLGLAAARASGSSFKNLLNSHVFKPLAIHASTEDLPGKHLIAVADVPSPYTGTVLEPYNTPTGRLRGTPWAGIQTNVDGLLALVRAYAPGSKLLSRAMLNMAQADAAAGLSGGFISTEPFVAHHSSRSITWSPCAWGLSIELQGGKQPH